LKALDKFTERYQGSPTAIFYSLPEYNDTRAELSKAGVSFTSKIIKAKKDKPAAYRIVLIGVDYSNESCPHCGDALSDYFWCHHCGDITLLDEYFDGT
jgi:hypothetical protein